MPNDLQAVPTKAGLYWARKTFAKYWNYLVRVEGTSPMLHIVWVLELGGLNSPRILTMKPGDIEEWGPRVDDPEEIQKVALSELERRH
jgi:hypothetical protein